MLLVMVELRPLEPKDAKEIAVWFLDAKPENKFIDFYRDADKWLEIIRELDNRFAYAAYIGSNLVGFVDFDVEGSDVGLAFGVAPRFRGLGVGKEMVSQVPELSEVKDAKRIIAGVELENTVSLALLDSLGYTKYRVEDSMVDYTKNL